MVHSTRVQSCSTAISTTARTSPATKTSRGPNLSSCGLFVFVFVLWEGSGLVVFLVVLEAVVQDTEEAVDDIYRQLGLRLTYRPSAQAS